MSDVLWQVRQEREACARFLRAEADRFKSLWRIGR